MFQPPRNEKYPPVFFRNANAENRVSVPGANISETEDPTRLVYYVIPMTCVIAVWIG